METPERRCACGCGSPVAGRSNRIYYSIDHRNRHNSKLKRLRDRGGVALVPRPIPLDTSAPVTFVVERRPGERALWNQKFRQTLAGLSADARERLAAMGIE